MKGMIRFQVTCRKCGYTWLSYSKNPKRCALCNNLHPEQGYTYKRTGSQDGSKE